MKNFTRLLMVCGLICLVLGCSGGKDVDAAKYEVNYFHKQMNLGLYSQIYKDTAVGTKVSISESQALELFSGIENKFGKYKDSMLTDWKITKPFSGDKTYITLTYSVIFEHGRGVEKFVFTNEKGKMRIFSYNIQSDDLIK